MHIEINFILPDGTKVEDQTAKPTTAFYEQTIAMRSAIDAMASTIERLRTENESLRNMVVHELHENCTTRIDAAAETIKRLQNELSLNKEAAETNLAAYVAAVKEPQTNGDSLRAEVEKAISPIPTRALVDSVTQSLKVNCEALFAEDPEGWINHTHGPHCANFDKVLVIKDAPSIHENKRPEMLAAFIENTEQIASSNIKAMEDAARQQFLGAFVNTENPAEPIRDPSYIKAVNNAKRAQLVCPQCEEPRQAMAFRSKNAAGEYVRHDTCSTCRNGGLAPGKKLCDKCMVGKGLQSFVDKVGVKHETCGSCRAGFAPIEGPMQTPEGAKARELVREIVAERKTTNGPVSTIKMHDGSQIDLSQREQICDECKASVDTSKEPYIGGLCIQCTTPELRAAARKHAQSTFQKWREKDELIDCSPEN